jgi:hypothetical protein
MTITCDNDTRHALSETDREVLAALARDVIDAQAAFRDALTPTVVLALCAVDEEPSGIPARLGRLVALDEFGEAALGRRPPVDEPGWEHDGGRWVKQA